MHNVRLLQNGIYWQTTADRACAVDVKSYNDVPVLFISFFLSSDRLTNASFNVPWWAHGQGIQLHARHIRQAIGIRIIS